jgi:hypothetical protein
VLEEKFSGSFTNLIKLAECSAEKFVKLVVENFSSYNDIATLEGKTGTYPKNIWIFPLRSPPIFVPFQKK